MLQKTSAEVGGMGHSVKRKEDLRFIQGKGTYVDDVSLPGMVYGHMVRSPYAHARITGIRSEEAKKLPGVLAVITGQDLEKAGLSWMPTLFHDKQMVLATGKVLFQSQEVAFVVAEDRYVAADAAEAGRWYRRAADGDDVRAQYQLGQMYFDGTGVTRDYASAYVWFSLAAAQTPLEDNRKGLVELRNIAAARMQPAAVAAARRQVAAWRPRTLNP